MPSLKQIGTICFLTIFFISPTFADNEPTLIPASDPGCNQAVLNTTEGSAALEAIYTPNTINTQWYTGYGENGVYSSPTTCDYGDTINLPTINPSRPGYAFNGWKLRAQQCLIPARYVNNSGTAYASKPISGISEYNGSYGGATPETYGLTQNGEWGVTFSYGKIKGVSGCLADWSADLTYLLENIEAVQNGQMDPYQFATEYTALAGQEKGAVMQQALQLYVANDVSGAAALIYQLQRLPADTVFTNSTTDRVCWCKVTHYTANGGTQCSFVPTAWVWFTREGEYSVNTQEGQRCVSTCANECAERVSRNSTHFLEQFFPFLFAQ